MASIPPIMSGGPFHRAMLEQAREAQLRLRELSNNTIPPSNIDPAQSEAYWTFLVPPVDERLGMFIDVRA